MLSLAFLRYLLLAFSRLLEGEKVLGMLSSNICRSADNLPHFSDPEISDLHRSQGVPDRRLGGGEQLPPLSPVATPMSTMQSAMVKSGYA